MRERPGGFQIAVAILSVAAVLLFIAGPPRSSAEPQARPGDPLRTISVTGEGVVRVRPDVAHATIGVEASAGSAVEAQKHTAARVEAVINRVRDLGVGRDEVQTVALKVAPVEPFGFRGSQLVEVTISDLGDLAEILDAALGAGASSIQRVTFALKDEAAVRKQAIDRAIKDARARAEAAGPAGRIIVRGLRSLTIQPSSPLPEIAVPGGRAADLGGALVPGETAIRATVQATFDLQ